MAVMVTVQTHSVVIRSAELSTHSCTCCKTLNRQPFVTGQGKRSNFTFGRQRRQASFKHWQPAPASFPAAPRKPQFSLKRTELSINHSRPFGVEVKNKCSYTTVNCLQGVDRNGVTFTYRGAHNSLARPTSRCILFDGENISFDASLVIYMYINSANSKCTVFAPVICAPAYFAHPNF